MITEKQIDKVIIEMESEDFENQFSLEQAEFWHYLNSENFKSLNETEHQALFYINSVIYHVVVESNDFDFDMEAYEKMEDINWATRDSNKSWATTKDAFFKDFPEEDLLAFVEDMLTRDEEDQITEIGEEIIFITSKSFIDFICSI